MVTPVYEFPPVNYTAQSRALTTERSTSTDLQGRPYFSQYKAARTEYEVTVSAVGRGRTGAGYMEHLRRLLDGKAPFVRIEIKPLTWPLAVRQAQAARNHGALSWVYQGAALTWTYKDQPLVWETALISVVSGSDASGAYIDVTGCLPNRVVAYPGEVVRQGGRTVYVVGLARSASDGSARIFVSDVLETGSAAIAPREIVIARVLSLSANSHDLSGTADYALQLVEVLPDDVPGGIEVVNPWR